MIKNTGERVGFVILVEKFKKMFLDLAVME